MENVKENTDAGKSDKRKEREGIQTTPKRGAEKSGMYNKPEKSERGKIAIKKRHGKQWPALNF